MTRSLVEAVRADGPLPLARVMALAADAYYASRDPFGAPKPEAGGDFVTAPEISQVFGELVGAWAADLWLRAGSPSPFILCELGPGRGTLLADLWRATRGVAGFHASARVHLVERSPLLRRMQAERIRNAQWHDSFAGVPAGLPLLLVGNEFLDALPLTQIERGPAPDGAPEDSGWRLRHVAWGLDAPAFVLAGDDAAAAVPPALRGAAVGSVFERCFAAETLAAQVARRLAADGGAALFVDYGHIGPALGDTLQAIHRGAFAEPLANLGEADLSAHVDFGAVTAAAKRAGAAVHGPADQGAWLTALGIRARADALKAGRDAVAAGAVEAGVQRLVAPGAMGRLFKVLALRGGGWPEPAGF